MESKQLLEIWVPSLEYYRTRLQEVRDIDPTPFPESQRERWKELIVYYDKRVHQYEDLITYLKNSERR